MLAKRAAILFTNPERVSDSCTIIFFLNIHQAITIGKATYHPLQKTTSMSYFIRRYRA
ncbi:hypothetical protein KKG31_02125 [Patescibacteria group bacterium]|nr:hypothetical protein [Patescibacteria group bacterium]